MSNWWDNYREDIETSESRMSMDVECGELTRPIGFFRLRERHRVKAIGIPQKKPAPEAEG